VRIRLLLSALCLLVLSIHTGASAADSSSWRIAQTVESALNNNPDDHTPASGSPNRVNTNRQPVRSPTACIPDTADLAGKPIRSWRREPGWRSGAPLSLCAEGQSRTGLVNPSDAGDRRNRNWGQRVGAAPRKWDSRNSKGNRATAGG
jgi:hypothetical protein